MRIRYFISRSPKEPLRPANSAGSASILNSEILAPFPQKNRAAVMATPSAWISSRRNLDGKWKCRRSSKQALRSHAGAGCRGHGPYCGRGAAGLRVGCRNLRPAKKSCGTINQERLARQFGRAPDNCKISRSRAQLAEGRNTAGDCRGYNARRADHACARRSRPTPLGRPCGKAA